MLWIWWEDVSEWVWEWLRVLVVKLLRRLREVIHCLQCFGEITEGTVHVHAWRGSLLSQATFFDSHTGWKRRSHSMLSWKWYTKGNTPLYLIFSAVLIVSFSLDKEYIHLESGSTNTISITYWVNEGGIYHVWTDDGSFIPIGSRTTLGLRIGTSIIPVTSGSTHY